MYTKSKFAIAVATLALFAVALPKPADVDTPGAVLDATPGVPVDTTDALAADTGVATLDAEAVDEVDVDEDCIEVEEEEECLEDEDLDEEDCIEEEVPGEEDVLDEEECEEEDFVEDLAAATVFDKIKFIGNGTEFCLDVQVENPVLPEENTPVQLWECNGKPCEGWLWDPTTGSIMSGLSEPDKSFCLDASDGMTVKTCNGDAKQKFVAFGQTVRDWNSQSNCLTVDGTPENGVSLSMSPCENGAVGGENQQLKYVVSSAAGR